MHNIMVTLSHILYCTIIQIPLIPTWKLVFWVLSEECMCYIHTAAPRPFYMDWRACASYFNRLITRPSQYTAPTHQTEVMCSVIIHLQGETNINHSHTRQTSGFLSRSVSLPPSLAALTLITAEMCYVGKKTKKQKTKDVALICKLWPTVDCLLSFSPLLCSLSVSSLGGRWQVSSRQEQQPFTSSNVFTCSKKSNVELEPHFRLFFWSSPRKIVHGRLVSVAMHYRSEVVHGPRGV